MAKTLKQIEAKVDALIAELDCTTIGCKALNCKLYYREELSFAILIDKNKKKSILNTDVYNRRNNFSGTIKDKYSNGVYDLLEYMIDMRLLTNGEVARFENYLRKISQDSYLKSKIEDAIDLLNQNDYIVKKT